MALSASTLQQMINSELNSQYSGIFSEVNDSTSLNNAKRLCMLVSHIATPIISHITSNAVVIVSPGILTSGGPTSQISVSVGQGTIT